MLDAEFRCVHIEMRMDYQGFSLQEIVDEFLRDTLKFWISS